MKKGILVFGAVAIALLTVSSVTAVNVPQLDESEELESEKIVDEKLNYVDPDIYLSGQEELNILLEALDLLDFDDDPDFYLLLQGIVAVMNSKGFVDSSSIEQIINDNDLEVGYIDFGHIYTGDGSETWSSGYCGGTAGCPKRIEGPLFHVAISYVLFATIWWNAYKNGVPIKITISGEEITGANHGVVLGYTGNYKIDAGRPQWYDCSFRLNGCALLIGWDYGSISADMDDDCYSQITPTSLEQNQLTTTTTQNLVDSTTTSKQNTIN